MTHVQETAEGDGEPANSVRDSPRPGGTGIVAGRDTSLQVTLTRK
jgi:hypothetical protein